MWVSHVLRHINSRSTVSSQGVGGLDDAGDKSHGHKCWKKLLLNITNCVIGFGYASVRMRVHSFLPLEDRG